MNKKVLEGLINMALVESVLLHDPNRALKYFIS